MKLKETYTREEANLLGLLSSVLGEPPHTFQENSAYWDLAEINFETKEIGFNVESEETSKFLYYTIAGIASIKGYIFEEIF